MPNNTGMIFGRVLYTSGSAVEGAEVTLNFIFGEVELGYVHTGANDSLGGYPRAVTNGDGKYVLPFFWDAVDIAKVTNGATASVLGMKFYNDGTYASGNKRGRLVLTLDMRKLLAVGFPSIPGNAPDAASMAKDFWASYRDMLPKHGTFPPTTPLLSTEVFGLLGKIDISIS